MSLVIDCSQLAELYKSGQEISRYIIVAHFLATELLPLSQGDRVPNGSSITNQRV